MSDTVAKIKGAPTAKEKGELIQKMLTAMKADSYDEYGLLEACVRGELGAELKGFGVKCKDYADKKFPELGKQAAESRKAKLDQLGSEERR